MNILITLFYSEGVHGGPMFMAELGEYLSTIGHKIYLAAGQIDNKTKQFYAKHNVDAYTFNELPLNIHYNLVWAATFPILSFLLKEGLKYQKIIYCAMSPFVELDAPPQYWNQLNAILCVSKEIAQVFNENYGIPLDKMTVFNNIVPLKYFDVNKVHNKKIQKIAIVSNHVPKELILSAELLKKRGINTTIYGAGYNYIPVTPELLSQYDVVITIGKTVEYCFAAKIPCFIYDRFGGNGYTNNANIDREEFYNFSGRSSNRKLAPEDIVHEILYNYPQAVKNCDELNKIAHSRYKVSTLVNNILNILDKQNDIKIEETKDMKLLFAHDKFTCLESLRLYNQIKESNESIINLDNIFSIKSKSHNKKIYIIITILGIKIKYHITRANKEK